MTYLWGRRLSAAVLGMLAIGLPLAWAPTASAATYHAFLCRVPYGPNIGKPAPTDGTTYSVVGQNSNAAQACADGLTMTAAMGGNVPHPYNDGASVTFTAPTGMTVSAFTLWRHVAIGPSQVNGAPQTDIRYTNGTPLDVCTVATSCTSRGAQTVPFAAGNEVGAAGLSGVTQVRWTANCGGTPGGTCPATSGLSAVFNVFAADMLLNDPTPPAVTGVAGPLLAGGRLTGAQSVSFNATDGGSGVQQGTLVVDGAPAGTTALDTNAACANLGVAPDGRPSYVNTQPCAPALSSLLTLDTDKLAPGAHALTVLVADAAGNETVAATTTISVSGSVPQGTPNGAGASRSAKLTARFAGKGKSTRTRTLSFRGRATITGKLTDSAGKAISAAAVDILVRERRSGADTTRIATATTGADGTFSLKLPAGPSRTITVQYTAFSGDATPAARVKLSALVRARLTASFSTRSPRAGARVRLNGRLTYLRRSGVIVSIQARRSGVWRTADTVETRKDGRFSWPYRFEPAQAGRTFFFRARVKSPNYPFAAGASRTIVVRVRR